MTTENKLSLTLTLALISFALLIAAISKARLRDWLTDFGATATFSVDSGPPSCAVNQ
jgi:hypothetical protein